MQSRDIVSFFELINCIHFANNTLAQIEVAFCDIIVRNKFVVPVIAAISISKIILMGCWRGKILKEFKVVLNMIIPFC